MICGPQRTQRGLATVEVATLLVALAAACVFLAIYAQRGMQGNLFGTSQAIGLHFDPRGPYTETQLLPVTEPMRDTVVQREPWGMTDAGLLEPWDLWYASKPEYASEPRMATLRSIPWGPVPREPAGWGESRATSTWKSTSNTTYNARP